MQLVQRNFINNKHKHFQDIDALAFASKNLYNRALYLQNEHYNLTSIYLNYNELDKLLQKEECYKALPSKVSQQTLLNLHRNWLSYFQALKEFKIHPEKFSELPAPPKFKDKVKGRHLLIYTKQAISKNQILSKTLIQLETKIKDILQVRIIHKRFGYFIEIVYERKEQKAKRNNKVASIDLGVNNLCSIHQIVRKQL